MANVVKYSLTTQADTLKIGNVLLGTNAIEYGPTSSTGFWNGIEVPINGYVMYIPYSNGSGVTIYSMDDDTELVKIVNEIGLQNYTTAAQALAWAGTQTGLVLINKTYPNVVEENLSLLLDAGFIPSYPKTGTSWYDLSGNNRNGTLANGPTFNSTDGSIVFDGTDDVVNFSTITASNWSFSARFKFNVEKTKTTQYCYFTASSATSSNIGRILLEFTYSATIYSLATDSSGNIYIGGRITEYNGTSRPLIAKLDSSGNLVTGFNAGLTITQTQDTTDIEIDSSDNIYYGGYNIGNLTKRNSSTGALIQTISTVSASITQANIILDEANNKVYIAGWFTQIQSVSAQRIARLNLSTMTIDATFNTTTGFVNTEDVQMMVLQPDGKLIVGGQFTSYKGSSYNRIIRLNSDASIDNTFNPGTGFNSTVIRGSIALQSDGKILVGGEFTTFNSVTTNRIVRLNSDGSRDSGFTIGTGFNSTVYSIKVLSTGKILIAGAFSTYNGTSVGRIVRLNSDGTLDTSFNTGGGSFNGTATVLHIQNDGKILVGGTGFTTYNGVSANQLCRLNSDGTRDNSFSSGTGILGAYRLNSQILYRNSSNTITSQYLYNITKPNNYNWYPYETASSVLNRFAEYALTKDSSGIYRQYWNGQFVQSADVSTALDNSLSTNRIGTLKGEINSVHIYDKALSASDVLINSLDASIVTSNLSFFVDAGNLISYENGSTSTYSLAGDITGTLTNGVSYSSINGGVWSFDGTDDWIQIPTYTFNNGNWTVSAWINADSLSNYNIISNSSGGPVSNAFGLQSGKIFYRNYDGAWQDHPGNTVLSTGNWYMLTWVNYAGASASLGTMQMFVNGVSDSSSFNSYTTNGGPCDAIGRNWFGYYDGRIGSVQFYTGSLSQSQILQNFNAQRARFGV
jgi:uncharacterized delta-60 repeat protein